MHGLPVGRTPAVVSGGGHGSEPWLNHSLLPPSSLQYIAPQNSILRSRRAMTRNMRAMGG